MGSHPLQRTLTFIVSLLCLSLSACTAALPGTATPAIATGTAIPASTPTPALPPTDTPQPPLVVLLAPPGGDASLSDAIRAPLQGLVNQAGFRFQELPELSNAVLADDLRLVVALAPDPGLEKLAADHPQTQFLGVAISGLKPAANLSLVGGQGERPDQVGYLAGYMAALITPDWRIGMISQSDTPAGIAARNAFINGAIYHCGLCRPSYPPFYQYPVYSELASGASQADQQAAADYLIANAVKTAYVDPGVEDESLLEYLAKAGINLIGEQAPAAGIQNQWVASISSDLTGMVIEQIKQLLQEKPGEQTAGEAQPLQVIDVNPALLSPGRQRLVENVRAGLLDGAIDTGVGLQTSESP